jgi:predicted ATPase/DNA-binding CsgD family transcriptional regulator
LTSATELDPLIGRDSELQHVVDLISAHRLVTLTGTGGTGKTRLARAIVEHVQARDRHAAFVDLSAVTADEQITATVLASLEVDDVADGPIDAIAGALDGTDALLMLDNLEHLPGAPGVVTELLKAVPNLRVAATSRRPLGVRGEIEAPIAPLDLPASGDARSVEASPSGALFLARTRAIGRLHQLDDATASDIAALVRRLDGLPLAIELAAARTRILTPAEILKRLDSHGLASFDSAAEGSRRSLLAILDWTLGLLSTDQRELMDVLVTCAGFDAQLAETLLPDRDVIGALDSLVTLGLVQPDGIVGGATRLRMLETVRADVARRLDPEARRGHQRRHAEAMLARLLTPASARMADAVTQLDADAENFRRALDVLEDADPIVGLRLWSLLGDFWETRGRALEGIGRFDRLSERAGDPTPELSAALSLYVSLLGGVRGTTAIVGINRHALEVARAVGDRRAEAHALILAALHARDTSDLDTASSVIADLDVLDQAPLGPVERAFVGQARYFAVGALHGPLSDEALAALEQSTELAIASGRQDSAIVALGNLALFRIRRDEAAEAVPAAERAVSMASAVDHRHRPWLELLLAMALGGMGENRKAASVLAGAVPGVLEQGSPMLLVEALAATITVAAAAGRPLDAAAAWGSLLAIVEQQGVDFAIEDRHLAERWLALVRGQVRTIDYELALREGRSGDAATLLAAVAERLVEGAVTADAAGGRPAPGVRLRHGELTPREVEILAMVGLGRTDPQIAESLYISPKTASVHVANIKSKLGLETRLEIALRARELGLVTDER